MALQTHRFLHAIKHSPSIEISGLLPFAEKAQVFRIDNWPAQTDAAIEVSLSRMQAGTFKLPYEIVLIERHLGRDHYEWKLAIDSTKTPLGQVLCFFGATSGDAVVVPPVMMGLTTSATSTSDVELGEIGSCRFKENGVREPLSDDDNAFFNARFCEPVALPVLLDARGVTQITHTPSAKIQKSRAQRGQPFLIEYHRLKIDLTALRLPRRSLGGTHLTPKWHRRRAHVRTLANGREVTVRDCSVGSVQDGAVLKHYEIASNV